MKTTKIAYLTLMKGLEKELSVPLQNPRLIRKLVQLLDVIVLDIGPEKTRINRVNKQRIWSVIVWSILVWFGLVLSNLVWNMFCSKISCLETHLYLSRNLRA